jgi:hypothetical protein
VAQQAADAAVLRVGSKHKGEYLTGQRAAMFGDCAKLAEKIAAAMLNKLAQQEIDRHHVESQLSDGVLVSARATPKPPAPAPELATAS